MFNRKLLFFIRAAEAGSFATAAKSLYVSPAAISQQISRLESDIGVSLFDRSGYRPILTEAGKYYYLKSKALIANYYAIVRETQEISTHNQARLKVGMLGHMETGHLPQILKRYQAKYPGDFVDIKKIRFSDVVESILGNTVDVAFSISVSFEGHSEIQTTHLIDCKMCVICSKNHPWASKKTISGYEIGNEPLISLSRKQGQLFFSNTMRYFAKDGVKPNIALYVDDFDELILAVQMNRGIAVVINELVQDEGELVKITLEHTHHHASYSIGYREKNNNPYVKRFIEEIVSFYNVKTE